MSMLPVQGSRSELKAGLLAGRLRQRSLRAQRHRVLGSLRRTATAVLLLSIADTSPDLEGSFSIGAMRILKFLTTGAGLPCLPSWV